jgi:nucleotide-binding universal stress UspA family protein
MTTAATGPVLIAFDGSPDSRAAIDYAGSLFPGRKAVVLSVWEPLLLQSSVLAASGMVVDPETISQDDNEEEAATQTLAREGAELARKAGLDPEPRWQRGTGAIWLTIVDVATELDAALIVTGSRGLGAVKSFLVGSVSDRVMHQARRPVLIVPHSST